MPRSEGNTDMAGELVLVIDDSPTITKVVQLVLTKAGYQVDTAPDGATAIVATILPALRNGSALSAWS